MFVWPSYIEPVAGLVLVMATVGGATIVIALDAAAGSVPLFVAEPRLKPESALVATLIVLPIVAEPEMSAVMKI